jgi:exodeoxyribonuclease V beta subunit
MEMERFLAAVLEPANESNVKTALVTDMMGVSGDDLAEYVENEKVWDAWVEKFESYRSLLMNQGFVSMARIMMTREGVKQRLRRFSDGERRVTNVLHCIELVHNASMEKKLGPEGLLKWFQESRKKERGSEADEYQIRLETDERAVKIVTVHKSKGLEYPIVFCPFSWGTAEVGKDSIVMYHNCANGYKQTIDLCSPAGPEGRCHMERERLAENIRHLYVSLTRAKYRCYVAWGQINECETSALAYLLHLFHSEHKEVNLAALKDHVRSLSDQKMMEDIERLVGKSYGAIELTMLPAPEGLTFIPLRSEREALECRQFSGAIEKDWRTTSFSTLISGRDRAAEMPDYDRATDGEGLPAGSGLHEPGITALSIFDFPRGAQPGTCLHDVFEHVNFALEDPEDVRRFIAGRLAAYGFEEGWQDAVYQLVHNVLTNPVMGKETPFCLSQLTPDDRLHEVEFYAPLRLISPSVVAEVFRLHPGKAVPGGFPGVVEGLGFRPHKGVLRGFIDMVFQHEGRYYIVDWKSNFLGHNIEDYGPGRLHQVMSEELYVLQYHIYAAALHRFLGTRIRDYNYEDHFGGVFYLFLRGIDPAKGPENGVFFDKPDLGLIEDLARYMTNG